MRHRFYHTDLRQNAVFHNILKCVNPENVHTPPPQMVNGNS